MSSNQLRCERLIAANTVPIALIMIGCVWNPRTVVAAPIPRDEIVSRLRHGEQLVRCAYAEFSVEPTPTRAEMLTAIKEVCNRNGRLDEFNSYVITDAWCEANRNLCKWWRKGGKERSEERRLDSVSAAPNILAYDGRLVRTVGTSSCVIDTVETADWNKFNRVHPFSFLFEFQNVPYSQLLASATEWSAERLDGPNGPRVTVRFRHPTWLHRWFVLTFDGQFRLVEREEIVQMRPERSPRLYERHAFSDYKRYPDESGETIDFPTRAEYTYYMGVSARGENVEYRRCGINLRHIEFNKGIADDVFVLAFPPDVKVFDRVHGLGWLKEGVDPEDPLATRSSAGRIALAVLAALALLLAAFVVGRKAIHARA